MRKKIVVVVVMALMMCSLCGAALYAVSYNPESVKVWKIELIRGVTQQDGETPDEGIPGGPPGTPG